MKKGEIMKSKRKKLRQWEERARTEEHQKQRRSKIKFGRDERLVLKMKREGKGKWDGTNVGEHEGSEEPWITQRIII